MSLIHPPETSPVRWTQVALVVAVLVCAVATLIRRNDQVDIDAIPPPVKPARTPLGNALFTSTREITCLLAGTDGTLWAGTNGGALRRDASGKWTKFTRADRLPSCEISGLEINSRGEIVARTPVGSAALRNGLWTAIDNKVTEPARQYQGVCVAWRNGQARTSIATLQLHTSKGNRSIPLPRSTGSHISALLNDGRSLLAALFGDGLWRYDGNSWSRIDCNLPEQAREITALARTGGELWAGTRRQGLWRYDGKQWTQFLQPGEPFNGDIENLVLFRGELVASTLEDGVDVLTGDAWRHYGADALSSIAPRDLIPYGDTLYVRYGTGKVDRFDGEYWTRDVCAALPRGKVYALASDGSKLYAAQWGGWSEFDGTTWTHYLTIPELQGLPIVTLYADAGTLYLGTESRGLAKVERNGDDINLQWQDERQGLPDDWVTVMQRDGASTYAGTFVGGLAISQGGAWQVCPQLAGQNVTALQLAGDSLLVGTRKGLWRRDAQGNMQDLSAQTPWMDTEIQALCTCPQGTWVGTRTGLYFMRAEHSSAEHPNAERGNRNAE